MSLKKPLVVSVAFAAVLTSACGSDADTATQTAGSGQSQKITTVSVGSPGSASDAGLYIADARGYFKAVGIEMEYQKVKGGGDLIPLLSTGKLDVGGLSINSALINAIASGNELEIVADKGSYTDGSTPSYGALLVRPDLADQVKGPGDLKGRNIAVGSAGSALDVALDEYLGQAGLSTDDVKLTVLGQAERVLALQEGAVDVAFVFEPFLAQAQKSGAGELLVDGGDMVANQQNAVVVYSSAFSNKEADVAQNFMSAYICGLEDYNTEVAEDGADRDDIIKIVADATGADPDSLAEASPIGLQPDGSLNVEDLERTIQGLAESGLVPQPVPAKDVVNTKFLENAMPCDELRDMAGGQ
jgi:NitT/TauT family transport system substrate-binding protein